MPEFKNKEEYEKWKAEKIKQSKENSKREDAKKESKELKESEEVKVNSIQEQENSKWETTTKAERAKQAQEKNKADVTAKEMEKSLPIKPTGPHKDTRENEDNKNNKRKQSSVMKRNLLLLVAIPSLSLIAIIIFVLLSSPNVSGLWTARAELVDAFKSLMKEPLDEKDKLPLDIELVLKHESRKIISGKFTLKHFSDANLDVPIEINGKIGNIIGIIGNDEFKHLNIGDIPVEFTGRNNMNLFEIKVSFNGEVKSEKLVGSLLVFITGNYSMGEYWHRDFRGDIEFKKY